MNTWYLYRIQHGVIKKINQAQFDLPYAAFNALRDMSYAIRDAGLDAKVRGTGAEPELVLDKNNSFRYSENPDLDRIKLKM